MPKLLKLLGVLFILSFGWSGFGLAQDTTDPMALENFLKTAEETGMQVIVVNPYGPNTSAATATVNSDSSFLVQTQRRITAVQHNLQNRLVDAPVSIPQIKALLNETSPTGNYTAYLKIMLLTCLLLIFSQLVVRETFGRRFVDPWFDRLVLEHPIGYTQKLPILVCRILLDFSGLFIVVLMSYLIGMGIFGAAPVDQVSVTLAYVYLTYVALRSVVFFWRLILCPRLPQYRIASFTDRDAKRLYYWLLSVATIAVIIVTFTGWLDELGLAYNVHSLVTSLLTLVVVFLNIVMVLFNWRAISNALLAGKPYETVSIQARFIVNIWAPFVILYFIVAWAEMSYRLIGGLPVGTSLISGVYTILLTVLLVYGLVGYVIERFFHRRFLMEAIAAKNAAQRVRDTREDEADRTILMSLDLDALQPEDIEEFPPLLGAQKMNTFEDLTRRMVNIMAIIAGFWALKMIWQIDLGNMSDPGFRRSYDVIAILFIGYFMYHFARIWIDLKIKEEGGDAIEVAPGDEGGAGGASRLATLLPLFRNFLLVVIFVSVTLIALSELGINVAPLFAGAGVVGLAIGFGSQSLVRDIFSGAFFLLDDAFRKGEYIDIGSVKGTVEKISPRSFQLRHHLGPLHTVPFGEIQHLTNFSRDWVMMKLPLRVTYDTDVEKVRKLVKNLGKDLMKDEVVGHQFIQPLKSQGVIEMQDSAMIIRVKFMTKPGDQWTLRKRVYQEIRDLFAKEGIKFAHREVTVRLAEGSASDLTHDQKEALGAAVLAMEDQDQDDNPNDVPGGSR